MMQSQFVTLRSWFTPLVLAAALAITACSSAKPLDPAERPVEDLYNDAMNELLVGSPLLAATKFDEVERQHPYSVWANKAQLMSAYSYYTLNRYIESVTALDRFIRLHPGSREVPYARYLRALGFYEQITDVGRDQANTVQALKYLKDVVKRYPNSKYARDARVKIDLTYDQLAGKEMQVGRFYIKRGHYAAAINRFRTVIEKYQTTSHVPEALHRLTESFLALGIKDEAQTAAAVLGHNFPGSEWYSDSYSLITGVNLQPKVKKGSWISRTWNSVF
ncbi:MAG: outer membrane protein assembly factor BamD [Alphaproteobacteria bacterium]